MRDPNTARRQALCSNIKRYSRLLLTDLTERERAYLHKQMAEDWALLTKLNAEVEALPKQASNEVRSSIKSSVLASSRTLPRA